MKIDSLILFCVIIQISSDYMGIYLNPTNREFSEAFRKEIYVDKSLLIEKVEYLKEKVNKYVCVLRSRRFGKSTDANMLVAYYSKGCDSSNIFDNLKISETAMYHKHLNKHNVIHLNMQDFYLAQKIFLNLSII